ncbi:unnamed protein product [Cylindrotheca closterium]|uniref:Uncharacterized protein n=1 Tax=Cylindrotheca closterium TaxID=2856 RepID=A0AAD2PUW2_9STRA|nr:unnamed protein product [Cylindrotheca closterium]
MTEVPNDSSIAALILDLKKDAVFGIDGQSIALRSDDFMGVSGLVAGDLHLLLAKGNHSSTLISAFLLYPESQQAQESAFVRRYNPQTEEVSAQPLDQLTHDNLLSQLPEMVASPTNPRVLPYDKIVSEDQTRQWKNQTNHIVSSGILRIRKIVSGEKLVPGAYETEDQKLLSISHHQQEQTPTDGKSISYPAIPVVDPSLSIWKTKHAGTKRYLKQLTATDRTSLFMDDNSPISNRLLDNVLQKDYEEKWQAILGDLQLSYTLFLYMQCFASLEHWKDLVAMICLVDWKGIKAHSNFYNALLNVLPSQISSIDEGFLEDMEEAGNNFLLPLLGGLCRNMVLSGVVESKALQQFHDLLMSRFPNSFSPDDQVITTTKSSTPRTTPPPSLQVEQVLGFHDDGMEEDDDDDEDAPVVVSTEDVQASLARSSEFANNHSNISKEIQRGYPLLVAAIMPQEDILMACARILDDKRDVSLVREAAAYLEEVEQRT